jgi:WD40 repeat protein
MGLPVRVFFARPFSNDAKETLTGFFFLRSRIRLFSAKSMKPLGVFSFHRSQVSAVAFHRDGRLLAGVGRDGKVTLWAV